MVIVGAGRLCLPGDLESPPTIALTYQCGNEEGQSCECKCEEDSYGRLGSQLGSKNRAVQFDSDDPAERDSREPPMQLTAA